MSRNSKNSFNKTKKSVVTTMTSVMGGFPDRVRVRLKYVTNVTMTPNGLTAADYVFSGNGCFDPDITSTGSQPANFDDWSGVYSRYRVWGSTLRWNVGNTASGTVDLTSFVVGPRHLSTALTTRTQQEYFQAQPYTRYFKSIIYANGRSDQQGSCTMSTAKFLGLSRSEFEGNDDVASLVSANPAHQWYWHCVVSSDDQSSSTIHYVNFVVEYDVEFWDRVDTTLDLKKAAQPGQLVQAPPRELVPPVNLEQYIVVPAPERKSSTSAPSPTASDGGGRRGRNDRR